MERKEDFQVFPWSNNREFENVAKIVLNLEFSSNLLYNLNFLKDLQSIERQMTIWKTKTTSTQHLYEIDATHSIINCLLHEHLPKLNKMNQAKLIHNQNDELMENDHSDETVDLSNEMIHELRTENDLSNDVCSKDQSIPKHASTSLLDCSSFNLINEETLAVLYANSILKFFKMLSYYDIINGKVERLLSRSEANLTRICEQLDFPRYIIEYRHRIAHNKLPSFDQLKLASQIALSWLKRNYWSRYLFLLDDHEKSKSQIYEQTKMILTNLFEIDDDVDTKLNKLKSVEKMKLSSKKRKIDLKKFAILDRKDIILLNDTLYDLLTEDFYTTLNAITLFIVDSTKEYLNDITIDTMRKWIEDDEQNFNQTLINNQTERSINKINQQKKIRLNDQQKTAQTTKKRDQLIPNSILNSFKPIFEIINKQLSSINQLLFNLYSVIEDEKIDLKTSAQVWFIQITCSLINNLNFNQVSQLKSTQDKSKITGLTEFEKCFKLTDTQLMDLKWIHLFTRLVEEPIMSKLNLCIVRRFYPLVSFRYSKLKFNQICDLLSIYLDAEIEHNGFKKKKSSEIEVDHSNDPEFFETNQFAGDIDWSKTKFGFI